jgi:hypothetical protein
MGWNFVSFGKPSFRGEHLPFGDYCREKGRQMRGMKNKANQFALSLGLKKIHLLSHLPGWVAAVMEGRGSRVRDRQLSNRTSC